MPHGGDGGNHACHKGDESVGRGRRRREDAQEVVTVDPAGGDHHGAADEVEDGEGRRKDQAADKELAAELEPEGEVDACLAVVQ